MRRWVWRGTVVVMALTVVLVGVVGVRTFHRTCDGSLEGLRYLRNVRSQLAVATAPPPTPAPTPSLAPTPAPPVQPASQAAPPTPTPVPPPPTPVPPPPSVFQTVGQRFLDLVGVAGDTVLVAMIRVKQNDAVAYPSHIVAAQLLSSAGCGKDAVRLQWLKAGLHASRDGQPERIATVLKSSASDPDDLTDLRQIVRTWSDRASDNAWLRRVRIALDEPST
jgi:hypothetical protein